MFARAIIIGLLLTSQLSAAENGRYAPPPALPGDTTTPIVGDTSSNPPPSAAAAPARSPFGGTPSSPAPPRAIPNGSADGTLPIIGGGNSSLSTPAAYQSSPPSNYPAAPDTGVKPSALMRTMLSPPAGSQLRGQPVSLMEVVGSSRNRGEQTQRIEAYWDLCSSVADYYLGLSEQGDLRRFAQRPQGWDQVIAEMQNRTATALRAAVASQMRLASLMGRGGFLPLPADPPHCASYDAHYEQIFARGGSAEAKELAALLPLRYAELKDAGADVAKSYEWFNSFATNRSGTPEDGLRAMELLALKRRAFVQIARDYNRRIARYSELASPGQISPERLTSMLIRSNVSNTATKSASPAPPTDRRSSNRPVPPTTFAGGATVKSAKSDAAVKPASAAESPPDGDSNPRWEHSLLVSPTE